MTKRKGTPAPQVVVISLWRDDAYKGIVKRTAHLLSKSYQPARFVWVVGDSADATETMLRELAQASHRDVTVITHNTAIEGDTPNTRLQRLARTFNAALDAVGDNDEWVVLHESDLISPPDVIERLLAVEADVSAGWVTLGEGGIFYDTYAYRRNGNMMSNHEPRPDHPFEMDSVGSVWRAPAVLFRQGLRAGDLAVIDVMRDLRAAGCQIVVDPSITIVQPVELWESREHANG